MNLPVTGTKSLFETLRFKTTCKNVSFAGLEWDKAVSIRCPPGCVDDILAGREICISLLAVHCTASKDVLMSRMPYSHYFCVGVYCFCIGEFNK